MPKIDDFDYSNLAKVFKRLRRNTKGFSSFIVRDPIDYLDFYVGLEQNLKDLIYEVEQGNYLPRKPYLHLSPKNKGINRPTVVFDVRDALVYRFCVEKIENELFEKTRQKNIRGGIKISPNIVVSDGDYYEKWFKDWREHLLSIEKGLKRKNFLVSTDIASYFENINILVLKDQIRSDISGKKEILNLLFFFLENTRSRVNYEVDSLNGLPQEDIECSRTLAYYFLHSHDNEMINFCKEKTCDFYRFVDDMSILVDSKVTGKIALKRLTESLRKLGLVSSIEKTAIFNKVEAKSELFFEENKKLSKLEEELVKKLKDKKSTTSTIKKIVTYYKKLEKSKKYLLKNWIKILKRFYTLFIYAKSDFFLPKIRNHLIELPQIALGNKILKYLVINQKSRKFKKTIKNIIFYLRSEENLYPVLETNLLEIFLCLNALKLDKSTKKSLRKLSEDILFSVGYNSLSSYARGIACLLFFKYNNENIYKLCNHYLTSNETDGLLKKYLIFVSLTVENYKLREQVLNKARKEQNFSINRLLGFIDNVDLHKNNVFIKKYLDKKEIYIYFKDKSPFRIIQEYSSVRSEILKKIILIYGSK